MIFILINVKSLMQDRGPSNMPSIRPISSSAHTLAEMYNRLAAGRRGAVLAPGEEGAAPLYVITGVNFTPYDPTCHGDEETHAFSPLAPGYLMNNGAAVATRLIAAGANLVLHGRDSLRLRQALKLEPGAGERVAIIGGDLATDQDASRLMGAIADYARDRPVREVRLMAYQSFAQTSGSPFKTMPDEDICEVERAASRRIRFVYNMAAIGYWLLHDQGQARLRLLSLSALAAHRPSFGLIADCADKAMNEVCWKTFHIESTHLTGKPVNLIQVSPGITTACDIYRGGDMYDFIHEEAVADGFPMARTGRLPQLSADDVGEVATRMLTLEPGQDPNTNLPMRIRESLYGGYTPQKLQALCHAHVHSAANGGVSVGTGADKGPDHLFAPYTVYGRLPPISPSAYQRISLTPPGQSF